LERVGEYSGGQAIDKPLSPEKARLRVVDGQTYENWEAVYRDNIVGIYHLVFRRVGNAPDAEDLAEEALLRALRNLRLPAPVHEVRAYLVKTARSVLAEHWRRYYAGRTSEQDLDELTVKSPGAEALAEHGSANAERASRILALLPDRFRQVLELRFLRGYSVAEAAKEMGVSDSNAKVIQYRALRKAAELAGDLAP
jgi:RNA polymerase sigma factor (sigma-70 family)